MQTFFKPVYLFSMALMLCGSIAHAELVPLTATSTGAFGDFLPEATSATISYSAGKNVFADQSDFAWGGRSTKSKLTFDGLTLNPVSTTFALGSLTYDNASILATQSVSSVAFDLKISIANLGERVFSYNINIDETTNTAGCNVSDCADIVSINPVTEQDRLFSTLIGNTRYSFEFLGFDSLGNQNSFQFITAENNHSSAQLFGRLTATTIPLPGAVWTFMAGFLVLGKLAGQRRASV